MMHWLVVLVAVFPDFAVECIACLKALLIKEGAVAQNRLVG
jgi:hypothetical protein